MYSYRYRYIHFLENKKIQMDFQITHLIKSLGQLDYYGSIPSVNKNLNKWEGRSFVLIASTKCNQETPAAEQSITGVGRMKDCNGTVIPLY